MSYDPDCCVGCGTRIFKGNLPVPDTGFWFCTESCREKALCKHVDANYRQIDGESKDPDVKEATENYKEQLKLYEEYEEENELAPSVERFNAFNEGTWQYHEMIRARREWWKARAREFEVATYRVDKDLQLKWESLEEKRQENERVEMAKEEERNRREEERQQDREERRLEKERREQERSDEQERKRLEQEAEEQRWQPRPFKL